MPSNKRAHRLLSGALSCKRLALGAFDAASAVVCALPLVVACPTLAWGYVDPSVMTYTIQALAGVAVALSAVLGVALRRTRKAIRRALNIDENAGKEIEPLAHRVDESGQRISEDWEEQAAGKACPKAERRRGEKPLRWRARLLYSCIVAVFAVFTLFVVAPYEIVASNEADLVFGLSAIWGPVALCALAIALVLAFAVSLLRGRAFQVAMLLVFSLGLACYIQALFFNGPLPAADGRAVAWGNYRTITVLSAAIWIVVCAAPLVLSLRFASLCRGAAAVASVCLIVVQAAGVASLFAQISPTDAAQTDEARGAVNEVVATDAVATQKGLFNVSPNENVIVFVLDTFDTADLDTLVGNDPSALDEFTGFTFFHDSCGMMIPTRYGVPYLLSGRVLPESDADDGVALYNFFENRYVPPTFFQSIHDSGYSIGVWSDSYFFADSGAEQYVYNMQDADESSLDFAGTVSILWKCALYRDMTWAFKPFFWFWTDEINNGMVAPSEAGVLDDVPYTMDDTAYYSNLRNIGLSVKTEGQTEGDFRFIHLLGAHGPYVMDENGAYVGDGNSSLERQCAGSIKIVAEYIRQLKELGLYDSATIIVTADHGVYDPADTTLAEPMDTPSSPVMLVKPGHQTQEQASVPYKVSNVQTGHLDFQATVLDAMGAGPESYATFGGMPMFQVAEGLSRDRYYYVTTTDWKQDVDFREYLIDGDVMDFKNWHLTGRIWSY